MTGLFLCEESENTPATSGTGAVVVTNGDSAEATPAENTENAKVTLGKVLEVALLVLVALLVIIALILGFSKLRSED